MDVGMLWFDNDPKKTLEQKVERAASYYQNKYGKVPNLCFINPSTLGTATLAAGMQLRASRSVLPNHFWLGVGSVA